MNHSDPILVSVSDFAARTSLSARHVWRLVARRQIPSHLIGRRRVIPLESAINALRDLENRVATPQSQTSHTSGRSQ